MQRDEILNILNKINNLKKLSDLSYEDIDIYGEKLGEVMSDVGLTTTQMRRIYSTIIDIKRKVERGLEKDTLISQLYILRPWLAYTAGRNKRAKLLCDIIRMSINKVKDTEDLDKLHKFMQAILAYHKYHGGRD